MAGAKIRQTFAQTDSSGAVEATAIVAHVAKIGASIQKPSGRRQPTGLSHPMAPVIIP